MKIPQFVNILFIVFLLCGIIEIIITKNKTFEHLIWVFSALIWCISWRIALFKKI